MQKRVRVMEGRRSEGLIEGRGESEGWRVLEGYSRSPVRSVACQQNAAVSGSPHFCHDVCSSLGAVRYRVHANNV
jgi:hypothetical protein